LLAQASRPTPGIIVPAADGVDMDQISFGTDGWRATLDTFTDERVRIVGQAVADHLDAAGRDGTVAVGYDARETSDSPRASPRCSPATASTCSSPSATRRPR